MNRVCNGDRLSVYVFVARVDMTRHSSSICSGINVCCGSLPLSAAIAGFNRDVDFIQNGDRRGEYHAPTLRIHVPAH